MRTVTSNPSVPPAVGAAAPPPSAGLMSPAAGTCARRADRGTKLTPGTGTLSGFDGSSTRITCDPVTSGHALNSKIVPCSTVAPAPIIAHAAASPEAVSRVLDREEGIDTDIHEGVQPEYRQLRSRT